MNYQKVPKTGWDISTLSFGCMRFADETSGIQAVRKAVESGVNYFDVAPMYGGGTAEVYLGKGLQGLRDKAIVTAKSTPGNGGPDLGGYSPETGFGIQTADQARRQIERSMKILGVDHLDMYQLWACHGDPIHAQAMAKGGFMEGVLKARDEGLFEYIGMTTHSNSEDIIRYVSESVYEFDMVTLPFHLRDLSRAKAVKWLSERGIGVVAMNPLAGGWLANRAPVLQSIALDLGFDSMVEAVLRYLITVPGVTTALNGITTAEQATEGANALAKGPMAADVAEKLLTRVQELCQNVRHFCTACGYCGKCPEGIRIPEVIALYSSMLIPSAAQDARQKMISLFRNDPESYDPAQCTGCKQCEAKCPNKLPISDIMGDATLIWKP